MLLAFLRHYCISGDSHGQGAIQQSCDVSDTTDNNNNHGHGTTCSGSDNSDATKVATEGDIQCLSINEDSHDAPQDVICNQVTQSDSEDDDAPQVTQPDIEPADIIEGDVKMEQVGQSEERHEDSVDAPQVTQSDNESIKHQLSPSKIKLPDIPALVSDETFSSHLRLVDISNCNGERLLWPALVFKREDYFNFINLFEKKQKVIICLHIFKMPKTHYHSYVYLIGDLPDYCTQQKFFRINNTWEVVRYVGNNEQLLSMMETCPYLKRTVQWANKRIGKINEDDEKVVTAIQKAAGESLQQGSFKENEKGLLEPDALDDGADNFASLDDEADEGNFGNASESREDAFLDDEAGQASSKGPGTVSSGKTQAKSAGCVNVKPDDGIITSAELAEDDINEKGLLEADASDAEADEDASDAEAGKQGVSKENESQSLDENGEANASDAEAGKVNFGNASENSETCESGDDALVDAEGGEGNYTRVIESEAEGNNLLLDFNEEGLASRLRSSKVRKSPTSESPLREKRKERISRSETASAKTKSKAFVKVKKPRKAVKTTTMRRRRLTKAQKAVLVKRLREGKEAAKHAAATRIAERIDFSNFIAPTDADDPLSQRLKAFDAGEKKMLSYIVNEVVPGQVCQNCMDLAFNPLRMSCCEDICCFECLTKDANGVTLCPLCETLAPQVTYEPEIEDTIKSLQMHCPMGCGSYCALADYATHAAHHCYQENKSERIKVANVKKFIRSEINEDIFKIASCASKLQLNEPLDIKVKVASAKFRRQSEQIKDVAARIDSGADETESAMEKEQRERETSATNDVLQNKVRPLERMSSGYTDKETGGGDHQSFPFSAWEKIHLWIMLYARVIFGTDTFLNCVDLGAGILLAIISGVAVGSNVRWIGLEIDRLRVNIGAKILQVFLEEWEKVSTNALHIGFLEADCAKPLNLRG